MAKNGEFIVNMKKKSKKIRFERINALLDGIKGKPNDCFDKKKSLGISKKFTKILSVKKDKQLFKSLVLADFNYLKLLKFACKQDVLQLLLPQSVVGRALTGQGWFTDTDGFPIIFKDATFDNVLTAIENQFYDLTNIYVRESRSNLIDNFISFILNNIDSETIVLEKDNNPFFGIKFFEKKQVKTKNFLIGMVIAGFMDDYEYRQKTVEKYKKDFMGNIFDIGGGEQFVIHREKFKKLGITDTTEIEFSKEDVVNLVKSGAVFDDTAKTFSYPEYDKMFFRFKDDNGISDDLALIAIGAIYGYDAMLGAFIMDAIDTYEKHLISFNPGGEDKNFANEIQNHFLTKNKRTLVSEDEIKKIIYIAAKNNSPTTFLSSSHRKFIQIEKGSTIPTLLNHWNFVSGNAPLYDILLGYSRVQAKKFYSIAYLRLKQANIEIKQPIFY